MRFSTTRIGPALRRTSNSSNNMAYTINSTCAACGACKEQCPNDAISSGDPYAIDPERCLDCGACESVCPQGAIKPE